MKKIVADQDVIAMAINIITEAMIEHDIPQIEGGCAMLAILESMKKRGVDLGIDNGFM